MLVLSGKEVATKVRSEVQQECTRFKQETGHTPCLAVVLVGDDPASATYVASKGKACEEMGFDHRDYRLPADTTEDYVVNLVEQLNADPLVDGILVQLPLPAHLNPLKISGLINIEKDVDGLNPVNIMRITIKSVS